MSDPICETPPRKRLKEWFSGAKDHASWWLVSFVFHGLLLAFIGLATLAIELGDDESSLSTMTSEFVDRQKVSIPKSTETDDGGVIVCGFPPDEPFLPEPDVSPQIPEYAEKLIDSLHGDIDLEVRGENILGHSKRYLSMVYGESTESGTVDGIVIPGLNSHVELVAFAQKYRAPAPIRRHNLNGWSCLCCGGNDRPLAWLARHQEEDGHWNSTKHGAAFKNDTAVTALAVLAFLGAGHTEKVGQYKQTVQRAIPG